MSVLRRKAVIACCLLPLASSVQAQERVRGEGRALVLEQDVAAAQRAALAEALRDASIKQGAVINASSVVTEQGGLEEQTVVHSTQKMLNYEVLNASVTDGVAETSIAAFFDQGTTACVTHRLGGAIDVTVASSSKGIPLDAAGVRGTSAYEAALQRRVFDALNSSASGTPFVFRKPVTSAYQQLTVPERESRAPRGSLRVAVTLNAQSSTHRREVARALIVTTDATFEDGFSGETPAAAHSRSARDRRARPDACATLPLTTGRTTANDAVCATPSQPGARWRDVRDRRWQCAWPECGGLA